MSVEVVAAAPEHIDEMGRVAYEAYKDLTDRHHFSPVFPNVASGRGLFRTLIEDESWFLAVGLFEGQVIGTGLGYWGDEVVALYAITVEPTFQGRGAARALMQYMVDASRSRGYDKVRLSQRAYNTVSLSLYTSLGFDSKESFVEMSCPAIPDPEGAVRPYTEDDLTTIRSLSESIYKVNRSSDIPLILKAGGCVLVRDHGQGPTGYITSGGGLSHGVASSQEDALALVGEMGLLVGDGARFNCPLGNGDLFRAAMKSGCRSIEVHTLMTLGPYESPEGVWIPSGGY